VAPRGLVNVSDDLLCLSFSFSSFFLGSIRSIVVRREMYFGLPFFSGLCSAEAEEAVTGGVCCALWSPFAVSALVGSAAAPEDDVIDEEWEPGLRPSFFRFLRSFEEVLGAEEGAASGCVSSSISKPKGRKME